MDEHQNQEDPNRVDPQSDNPTNPNGTAPVDQAAAPPEAASPLAELEAELAAARARVDELTDQLQRTGAEFQNARRRQQRQTEEQVERANEKLIMRLLPVLDDFNLAYENVPGDLQDDAEAWVAGFRHIQRKLEELLKDEGVQVIEDEGAFDPTHHEAISHEPNNEVTSGHIIQTLRAGYTLKNRVLRPALVRVAQ